MARDRDLLAGTLAWLAPQGVPLCLFDAAEDGPLVGLRDAGARMAVLGALVEVGLVLVDGPVLGDVRASMHGLVQAAVREMETPEGRFDAVSPVAGLVSVTGRRSP